MEKSTAYDNSDSPENCFDEEAIQRLKRELIEDPNKAVIQLGKYGVTIGQASELHIGDVIHKSFNQADIDSLASAIKEANKRTDGLIFEYLKNQPLEPLKVNFEQVKEVNSDLEYVRSLELNGYLEEPQKSAFKKIKHEIHTLNDFSRKLERLHFETKALLTDSKMSLIEKIKTLKTESEKALDPQSLINLAQEKECREGELRILHEFMEELEASGEVAVWIENKAKVLAKRFGREALDSFPDIKNHVDDKSVGYFCYSLYQFLEQISHCLKWGRYDILDSPEIPLVLDFHVYEKAFYLIKENIDESLPLRFSQVGKRLMREYMDYAISQFSTYEYKQNL
jgi:hypothetical protein